MFIVIIVQVRVEGRFGQFVGSTACWHLHLFAREVVVVVVVVAVVVVVVLVCRA